MILSAGQFASGQVSFRSVGHLPGGTASRAMALSGDGLVVVGSSGSSSGNQAFRWTESEGMTGLGDFPGGLADSGASGASPDGSVIFGTGSSARIDLPGYETYRWTKDGGMVSSGHPSGATGLGVSADGSVVVGAAVATGGTEAYRWVPGLPLQSLGDLPGGAFSSQATAASSDGRVIVGLATTSVGTEAFRWTRGTGMVGLGDLPGGAVQSVAYGVSGDGSVVVGSSISGQGSEAFRWTSQTGMTGLGDLPGGAFLSIARAISGDGTVIVGYATSAAGQEAVFWTDASGPRNLRDFLVAAGISMQGWQLTQALGVSADGTWIVGVGRNPAGRDEGWVARIGASSRPALVSNLSIRATLSAAQILTVGMVVAGGAKDVLVRAVGPGLAPFGVATFMSDPRVQLTSGANAAMSNDDWPGSLATAFSSVGAFNLAAGSRDSAMVQPLNGPAIIEVSGSGPGIVLVEAYAMPGTSPGRLVNLSTRGQAGSGQSALIAGFNVVGVGVRRLLIRGVGPGLIPFGVTGTVADPRLQLFNADGNVLASNDNWSSDQGPTFTSVGAFPLATFSRDAAFVVAVVPGSYTVQLDGVSGTVGEALIELYELP